MDNLRINLTIVIVIDFGIHFIINSLKYRYCSFAHYDFTINFSTTGSGCIDCYGPSEAAVAADSFGSCFGFGFEQTILCLSYLLLLLRIDC